MKKLVITGAVIVVLLGLASFLATWKPSLNIQAGVYDLEVKAGEPHALAGKQVTLTLDAHTSFNGIPGAPTIQNRYTYTPLHILPTTVIADVGHVFSISTPHDCKTHSEFRGDVGYNIVDSCLFTIEATPGDAPVIELQALEGELTFNLEAPIYYRSINGQKSSPLKKIHGDGIHFVGVRVVDSRSYLRHGSDEVFVDVTLDIVTSFGIRRVVLKHGEQLVNSYSSANGLVELVYITPLSYDGKSAVTMKVWTEPQMERASAAIVEYDDKAPAS